MCYLQFFPIVSFVYLSIPHHSFNFCVKIFCATYSFSYCRLCLSLNPTPILQFLCNNFLCHIQSFPIVSVVYLSIPHLSFNFCVTNPLSFSLKFLNRSFDALEKPSVALNSTFHYLVRCKQYITLHIRNGRSDSYYI